MKETPLTLAEAYALSREYKHIVGQPFCGEYRDMGNVEDVVVAPYGKLNKWMFIRYYQKLNDAVKALSFYNEKEYAVVVIGRSKSGQAACMDLIAHLAYTDSRPDLFIDLD